MVEEHGFTRALETGLAFGASAIALLTASTSPSLTSIDPYQAVDYNNEGLRRIQESGTAPRHTHLNQSSDLALASLVQAGSNYDFIFIDGDHKFSGAFVDFHFASQLLQPGGVVVFHDLWMRSLILIRAYIKHNRPDFEEIALDSPNMAGFKRIDVDRRDGMVFREFYTYKGWLKYHINRLAWENQTVLGKVILRTKRLLKTR